MEGYLHSGPLGRVATLGSPSVELFLDELVKAHLEHLLVSSPMEAESCVDQDLEMLVVVGLCQHLL